MAGFNMDDYVDVAERINTFYKRFPDGSLKTGTPPHVMEVNGKTFIVYHAQAYRTPDDTLPGDGWAWEPVPGPTQFTKDSELMNAETASWGRAIVSLGFSTKKIASRQEVQNRSGAADRMVGGPPGKAGVVEGAATVPATPATNGDGPYISKGDKSQQQVLWITATENKVSKERVREIVLEICGAKAAEHTEFILKKDFDAVLDAIKMDGVPFG